MDVTQANNPNSSNNSPLLHQPQDCENDRKSRSALAFIALTYIQLREALVTGFLNKALSLGPLVRPGVREPPTHPLAPIHCPFTSRAFPGRRTEEQTDGDLGVLQSVVSPGFQFSCLWLLQFKSCLPSRQEGPAGPWVVVSRQEPSWLQALVFP